ncbi:MAG: 4-aminobutyrate--2-oxoglutarate transaminase [Elusimicrobia bacterium]|nr:4-aminobutyrate--2-oxoglutarate transaminase [Elusimicrobiota bacterium]
MTIQLRTPVPGPKSKELMGRRRRYVARGPFHATPVFLAKAKGAVIEDVDGNRFIDFASGIGVANVGHSPDAVVRAAAEQAARCLHAGFNVTPYEGYVELSRRLCEATPGAHAKKALLVNCGAEAVENAVKIARCHTKRQAVVCFDHGFHGRTYMAMTLTSKAKPYKLGFGPFCPEVYRAPFPYAYRWPSGGDGVRVSLECFERFKEIVEAQIGPANVAAVIIEPVLGEGGFVPAPKMFLASLQDYCRAQRIVLIADEIQTGFGRTGSLFACGQMDVEPDLMTLAKGLGGGMPLAAVVGRSEIMDAPIEGGVGGTYGGNPVACAAALAVLDLFEDGSLLARSRALGERLERRLAGWRKRFDSVGDVRGLGPMRALEFVTDRGNKNPDREAAGKLARYCYEHGVIVLTAGTYGNVVRILVPLCASPEELEEGLDVMEAGLKELEPRRTKEKKAGSRAPAKGERP